MLHDDLVVVVAVGNQASVGRSCTGNVWLGCEQRNLKHLSVHDKNGKRFRDYLRTTVKMPLSLRGLKKTNRI